MAGDNEKPNDAPTPVGIRGYLFQRIGAQLGYEAALAVHATGSKTGHVHIQLPEVVSAGVTLCQIITRLAGGEPFEPNESEVNTLKGAIHEGVLLGIRRAGAHTWADENLN